MSTLRASIEKASLPLLTRMASLPRALPFLLVLLLLVGGIAIPGWGFLLTLLVVVFLAWILFLGWPRLNRTERLMRIAVIAMAVAITITQAVPRS